MTAGFHCPACGGRVLSGNRRHAFSAQHHDRQGGAVRAPGRRQGRDVLLRADGLSRPAPGEPAHLSVRGRAAAHPGRLRLRGPPRHEHHGRGPSHRRRRRGRGQDDQERPRQGPVGGADRRALHRSVLPGLPGAEHHQADGGVQGDRSHPGHDRADRAAGGARPHLPGRRQRLLRHRHVPVLRAHGSARPGRAAGRLPHRGGCQQARTARLRPVVHQVEVRAAGDALGLSVGDGLSGLAHRVQRDVDALPGRALRHPLRRRRSHPRASHQ